MRKPRIRTQVAFLLFMLPAAAGVVAVHASPTCQRFVRTYVTKPVRNTVSKETAAAWAAWRVAHPNWKPNPNVHRPKYVMTRQEQVEKVDFACSVPEVPVTTDGLLKADLEVPPPIITLPPMDSTEIAFPDEIPPEVAEVTPDEWPPLAPFVPPVLGGPPGTPGISGNLPPPPIGGATPEPASWLLVLTGLGLIGLVVATRTAQA